MQTGDIRGLVLNARVIPGQKMYEASDVNDLSGEG